MSPEHCCHGVFHSEPATPSPLQSRNLTRQGGSAEHACDKASTDVISESVTEGAIPRMSQKTVRVGQAHPRSLGRDAASSDWVCLQGWPDSILRMRGEVVQDIAPSLWVGPCRGTVTQV